nr:hypothetical protein OH837_12740 [Streptomyces canus]
MNEKEPRCSDCGALVPDGPNVVIDTGPHSAVMICICDDCHTPEFRAYLDDRFADWHGGKLVADSEEYLKQAGGGS